MCHVIVALVDLILMFFVTCIHFIASFSSKCPKCDFQAIVPETEQIFDCPQCQHQSCRKCGEDPHIPLRCEEVEKKDETSARIRVEEAMTKARVRHCPNGCKQPFYKTEGCNKSKFREGL